MKKMVVMLMMLLIVPAFIAPCSQPHDVIPGYEGTRLNPDFLADVEFVYGFMLACIQGDREGMERYMHENYVLDGPGNGRFTREQEIQKWVNFAEQNDNARLFNRIWYSWVVDETFGNPDLVGKWVVSWHNFSFRHKANGKEVSFPSHVAIRISDGKVDYIRHQYDQLCLFNQLGYRLLPPEPTEE